MLPDKPGNSILSSRALFWVLQLGGWFSYAVLNFLIGPDAGSDSLERFELDLLYALGGAIITMGLRSFFRLIWLLNWWLLALLGALGIGMASLLFTGYRSFVHISFLDLYPWADLELIDYFNLWDLSSSLYVIGAWSGFYVGIRLYRIGREQQERLLIARNAANVAQLKMLRYQLNPHFLFNTLNAISTLVLERDFEAANRMLSGLSAFLRHSLQAEHSLEQPLGDEIAAINLYLEIERLRFGDHLEVVIDLAEETLSAKVPSLLLQPLVENAVKHAISLNEAGGVISITSAIEDGKLCLRVLDTGPGSANPDHTSPDGAGVGLSNLRERLATLYGDQHAMLMEQQPGSGLAVTIRIPFEQSK